MHLPQTQCLHFDVFGFVVLKQVFTPSEMEELTAAAMQIFEEDSGKEGFDGSTRQQIQGFAERHPALATLISDDRIFVPAGQLLGEQFIWIGSDGNRYVGHTGWHPDGSNLQYLRIKVAFYLDPLTRQTGALRVIPGSQRDPLHSSLRFLLQRDDEEITPYGVMAALRTHPADTGVGVDPMEVPCHAIESKPGDVVLFNQNVWHASYGGPPGRRMFTLNFGMAPRTDADWRFVRAMYEGQLEHVTTRQGGRRESLFTDLVLHNQNARLRELFGPLTLRGMR